MKNFLPLIGLMLLSACAFSHGDAGVPSRSAFSAGQVIVVERNQNAYMLARQYNVPMRGIIALNDLRPPYQLRAGEQITLPIANPTYSGGGDMRPPRAAPAMAVESAPVQPMDVQSVPLADDSVTSAPLEPLTPPPASEPVALAPPPEPPAPVATTVASEPASIAQLETPSAEEEPAAASTSDDGEPQFQWPLQGPILTGFGARANGVNNDGINIGAPKGAPVSAAAGGIVVYAGNEMKGFGNLVLVRHQGGWVTAYAHLDRVMVAKDNVVATGDMIGTVGSTGGVSAPQLHFETRLNGKPVDPKTVIKNAG